jgi:hypothetical protein
MSMIIISNLLKCTGCCCPLVSREGKQAKLDRGAVAYAVAEEGDFK